jgi:hypothetical protein
VSEDLSLMRLLPIGQAKLRVDRLLVVGRPEQLAILGELVRRDDVDVAVDALRAVSAIDSAVAAHRAILWFFSDGDEPGPELWTYLAMGNARAIERLVFVATPPLCPESRAFLQQLSIPWIDLANDGGAHLARFIAPGDPGTSSRPVQTRLWRHRR